MCITANLHKVKLLAAVLIMVFVIGLFYLYEPPDIRKCFKDQKTEWKQQQTDWQRLEDVLTAARQPKPGRSIFFIDTICRQPMPPLYRETYYGPSYESSLISVDALAACAIESAAMHNPRLDVYLLFASPVYMGKVVKPTLVEAMLTYSNVHFRNVDLWTYAAGSPLQDWLESEAVFNSSYVMQHVESFLSFLTLWHYGGTTVRLDSIMLDGIDALPPNFAGVDWNFNLLSNVMNFSPTGLGHDVAKHCLEEFQRDFNGRRFDSQNRRILRRVLEKLNETKAFGSATENASKCNKFYPQLSYISVQSQLTYFFKTQPLVCALGRNHFRHLKTSPQKFDTNLERLYSKFMRTHCPRVAVAIVEYIREQETQTRFLLASFN